MLFLCIFTITCEQEIPRRELYFCVLLRKGLTRARLGVSWILSPECRLWGSLARSQFFLSASPLSAFCAQMLVEQLSEIVSGRHLLLLSSQHTLLLSLTIISNIDSHDPTLEGILML